MYWMYLESELVPAQCVFDIQELA